MRGTRLMTICHRVGQTVTQTPSCWSYQVIAKQIQQPRNQNLKMVSVQHRMAQIGKTENLPLSIKHDALVDLLKPCYKKMRTKKDTKN